MDWGKCNFDLLKNKALVEDAIDRIKGMIDPQLFSDFDMEALILAMYALKLQLPKEE